MKLASFIFLAAVLSLHPGHPSWAQSDGPIDTQAQQASRIEFAFGSADLSEQAIKTLKYCVQFLKEHPDVRVEVSGHTDSIGTSLSNNLLSTRRARAAYRYLQDHGIGNARLEGPIGRGEGVPVAPNETADGSDYPLGRSRNRRVEITLTD